MVLDETEIAVLPDHEMVYDSDVEWACGLRNGAGKTLVLLPRNA